MNLKPPRILFVDDHQDTLDFFVIALSQENYEIVTATSIERALAETKVQHFDLLVLDAWVGDGSGIELCKKIREIDQITPILFYSGAASENNKKEALNAGAQRYLVKPVSIPDLYEAIRELISTSAQPGFNGSGMGRRDSGDLLVAH